MKFMPLHGKYGEGRFTLVDDEDFEYLNQFNWHLTPNGYAKRCENRTLSPGIYSIKNHQMSRNIMNVTDRSILVDHINHDKLDNRKRNLRLCTATQNLGNMVSKTGNSKYKGVRYRSDRKKWVARIHKNHKQMNLGHYETEIEAAEAYDKKALEIYGEFANPNFPRGDYA